MTRLSKKCVWVIVLVIFAAAMLTFFGWATSGFRNWDSATWFNYWWQGKPAKVVTVEEHPIEQRAMALTSADGGNSLIHDSDDTAITFALTTLPAPSYEWQADGLHVWTDGTHIVGGSLEVRYVGYSWGGVVKTFTYTNTDDGKSEEFVVSYNEFDPARKF